MSPIAEGGTGWIFGMTAKSSYRFIQKLLIEIDLRQIDAKAKI